MKLEEIWPRGFRKLFKVVNGRQDGQVDDG